MTGAAGDEDHAVVVAHLTTVASSLRYLLYPQLTAVVDRGGTALGISAPGAADVEVLTDAGVRHLTLGASTRRMNPLADLRAAVQLWRILRHERVDVLHTHNPKPGLYGRVVGRLARVPVVVNTNHGLYATERSRRLVRLVVLAMEAVAARFSHAELVQNPEDLQRMTRWRVNRRRRTSLLGNGVDLQRFRPGAADVIRRVSLRTRVGADDDTIVVGMVGRLVREKGCPELFEAARQLGERFPHDRYVVVVVGPVDTDKPDSITPDEVRRAEDAGVVFLGHRDDVEELYGAMDLFVLPSHREGFPRAAMEAAASGLPVIATDVRGCRQVVEHDVTGLLVPLGDAPRLADAIAELGEDRARRQLMGKAAVARAEAQFDERQVVRKVLDAYRAVAERKGRADLAAFFAPAEAPAPAETSAPADA